MDIFSTQQVSTLRSLTSAKRIVSLVPSLTELLSHLDLEERVVGITKFCVHPNTWFRQKIRIGGTKTVHIEKVKALKPDLIIANKEENVREQVVAMSSFAPVLLTDIQKLEDALDAIRQIGLCCGVKEPAEQIASQITAAFYKLPTATPIRIAYLIWQQPIMTIGRDTFIHDMLEKANFENVFEDRTRYPQISEAELVSARPQAILLSSEPFPFKEKHQSHFQAFCPGSQVHLVDGELFSWYGSRLLKSAPYMRDLRKRLEAGIAQ